MVPWGQWWWVCQVAKVVGFNMMVNLKNDGQNVKQKSPPKKNTSKDLVGKTVKKPEICFPIVFPFSHS